VLPMLLVLASAGASLSPRKHRSLSGRVNENGRRLAPLSIARGGAGGESAKKKGEEPEPEPNAVVKLLDSLPPGVRYHVVAVAAATVVGMSGLLGDPEATFALDLPGALFRFQAWRPFTAAVFLGTPSMAWATSIYLLVKYGCELEAEVGSEAYFKFLVVEFLLLTIVGSAIGLPFVAKSLVTAIIYASSRLHPFADINFQFGINIKYWMLPFGLSVIEMLQTQSAAAAIPHVVGVLCAHFHHFLAVVWPRLSRELQDGATTSVLSSPRGGGKRRSLLGGSSSSSSK